MSLNESTRNVKASLIIEVLGRPPEHLVETLEDIIKKIGEEKGIEVIEKKIKEPTLLKDQKDFYTSFAEIEIEAEEMFMVVALIFKYMPAHIEIIEPENIFLSNHNWNEILNEIALRLHKYDSVARMIQTEKTILEKKLKDALEKKD